MMTALLILGLAFAGLSSALIVVRDSSRKIDDRHRSLAAALAAQRALDSLFQKSGPFRQQDAMKLTGDGTGLTMDCAKTTRCSIRIAQSEQGARLQLQTGGEREIRLGTLPMPQFRYVFSAGRSDHWPLDLKEFASKDRLTLRAVELISPSPQGEKLVASATVWREQAGDCQFDPIALDCR